MKNIIFWAAVLFLCMAGYSAGAGESPVYTNSDLGKYRAGSQGQPAAPSNDTVQTAGSDTQGKQQQWCSRGKAAGDRVREAEARLSEAQEARAAAWRKLNAGNRSEAVAADAAAQKQQEDADSGLVEAKQAKESIEDEAHREGIPPGWLRCQFE